MKKNDVNRTKLTSMKKKRSQHAAFYLENKLYIVGGKNRRDWWLDSCEVFDFVKKAWSDRPKLPYTLLYPRAVYNPNDSFALVQLNVV